MIKRILAFFLILALLITAIPGYALSNKEKYESTIEALQNYLNGDQTMSLDEIYFAFSSIAQYELSARLRDYTDVLRRIERNDFGLIERQIANMRKSTEFGIFLSENTGFGTLDELQAYASAREAELNKDYYNAELFYNQCIDFLDSYIRMQSMQDNIFEKKYQEALTYFALDSYEGYEQAYEIFLELSQINYKDSVGFLTTSDEMRILLKPTATPNPTPAATPRPTPSPTPASVSADGAKLVKSGEQIGNYIVNLYEDGTASIQRYTGSLTDFGIPEIIRNGYTVTSIGKCAFTLKDARNVTLPDTIITIEESAFADSSLSSIQLSNILKTIDKKAFSNCYLKQITIPDGVTSIGDRAFFNCQSLTNVIIPDSVKEIGEDAFALCPSVTLYVTPGSFAEKFAIKNNLRYSTETPAPTATPKPTPAAHDVAIEYIPVGKINLSWRGDAIDWLVGYDNGHHSYFWITSSQYVYFTGLEAGTTYRISITPAYDNTGATTYSADYYIPSQDITLIIPYGSYGEWNKISTKKYRFYFDVENTDTSKTVQSYDVSYYTTDANGNMSDIKTVTLTQIIKPGEKVKSKYIYLEDPNNVYFAYAAIDRVTYTDGTIADGAWRGYIVWDFKKK